ncbi:MAG TPA: VCBS domain-containing protein, partial [Sphingomicrobium sp.]
FTITPAANFNGTIDLKYQVTDGAAAVIAGTELTIAAVNDPAVIGGSVRGTVVEARNGSAGTPVASGTLTIADLDGDPQFQPVDTPTVSAAGYGMFTISSDGNWEYALDNSNAQVNALRTGQALTDSFTVRAADGTTRQISVTIYGGTDWVVVGPYDNTDDPDNFDNSRGPAGSDNPNATIVGTSSGESVTGGAADQNISLLGGNDVIYGGGGNDTAYGGSGHDFVYGQAGDDFLSGDADNDNMRGGSGNDVMLGGDGFDTIYGGSGNDTINGGAIADFIYGGYGADTLTGGAGSDWFNYSSVLDSGDTITDFEPASDTLDLHLIDANTTQAGNQEFTFSKNGAAFNSIWMIQNGSNMEIYGDTDGNPTTAEFMLTLENVFMPTDFPPPHIIF